MLRISVVPLRRVLPMVSAHPGLVARRVVSGRLRLVRAGGGLYLSQEDYLSLCEGAWQSKVAKGCGRRDGHPAQPPEESDAPATRPSPKPIHDARLPGGVWLGVSRFLDGLWSRRRR